MRYKRTGRQAILVVLLVLLIAVLGAFLVMGRNNLKLLLPHKTTDEAVADSKSRRASTVAPAPVAPARQIETSGQAAPGVSQETVQKFVPKEATPALLRSVDPEAQTETSEPAAMFGRLSGKDTHDLAFIYQENGQLKLRTVQNPDGEARYLDQQIPGTFLWMQNFKTNGFQVLDLNGDGVDEIATITSEGASLGAYLNVFTIRRGKIESLLEQGPIGGYEFQFVPSHNGGFQIIAYTDKEKTMSEIYEWNGDRFKKQT
jgi:hypothetical protein